MWSLQFLTIMVMVDYADQSDEGLLSLTVCVMLTCLMAGIAATQLKGQLRKKEKVGRAWNSVRRRHLRDYREQRNVVGTVTEAEAKRTIWVGGIPVSRHTEFAIVPNGNPRFECMSMVTECGVHVHRTG